MEERDYAGVCGLYCGLCPRFQSTAASRCPGCQLGPQHDYCSVYRCARKRGYWTCAECGEYPCERLLRLVGDGADSFLSHRPMLPNLERTGEAGLDTHLDEQRERRLLAEQLIGEYNEGRSMTFYCTAAALLAPAVIRGALQEMEEVLATGQVDGADIKAKAKVMKALITERADQAGVDLKLRRKKKGE
jgi:hypothetical protein